jgi:glycosyltransferase involved in cell wall biosynthesis
MNILLTNFHPQNGGGHTTYLHYLFKELSKKPDLVVYLAAPKTSRLYKLIQNISPNNLVAIDFPGKVKEIKEIYKNTKIFANFIKEKQIDLVHTNGNPEHKIAMYCKMFCKLNFKIVRTKHDSKAFKNNFLSKLQYKKHTDNLILVSHYQLKQIKHKFILDKTTVIHNGIDLDFFTPRDKNSELLNKYNIKPTDLVFVSVAGSALHKGWQHLVEVVSMLDNDIKNNIKIVIAGHPANTQNQRKYVDKFNMQENVVWEKFVEDVRDVVSVGDVGFVLSTSIETISFACREMMALGKPVIVSNYAGLPENIDNNKNGWVVDVDNKYEFKNTIESAIKSNLDEFSKNATQKARAEFGLTNFVEKTYKIYSR